MVKKRRSTITIKGLIHIRLVWYDCLSGATILDLHLNIYVTKFLLDVFMRSRSIQEKDRIENFQTIFGSKDRIENFQTIFRQFSSSIFPLAFSLSTEDIMLKLVVIENFSLFRPFVRELPIEFHFWLNFQQCSKNSVIAILLDNIQFGKTT